MNIEVTINRKQLYELIDQFLDEQQHLLEQEKLIRKLIRSYQEWVEPEDMEKLLKPFLKKSQ